MVGLIQIAATRAAAEDAYYTVKKGTAFTLFMVFTFFLLLVFDLKEAL